MLSSVVIHYSNCFILFMPLFTAMFPISFPTRQGSVPVSVLGKLIAGWSIEDIERTGARNIIAKALQEASTRRPVN